MCVCSLRYPAWNGHAPYCHLWPFLLFCNLTHYLINGTIFEEKKLLSTKCFFWFSLQVLCEIFLILRRIERDMIKMYSGLLIKHLLFLSDCNELEFYAQIFEKHSSTKLHGNPCSGNWVVPCGQTDMTKRIFAFLNFANPFKKVNLSHCQGWTGP